MNIIRPNQGNHVTVNRVSGKIVFKDITDSLDFMKQNLTEDHLYQLIVCSPDTDFREISLRTKRISYHFQQVYKDLSAVSLAIVSETDLGFGISRMIQIQAETETIEIQVFRTEQEARTWLQNERCHHIKDADKKNIFSLGYNI